jgi:transcriptional regulator with XRE-family HTH domain
VTGHRRPDEFTAALARRVRAAREGRGISQSRLERDAGIRPALVAQLERGEIDIGVVELAAIAAVLDVDVCSLISPPASQDPEAGPPSD